MRSIKLTMKLDFLGFDLDFPFIINTNPEVIKEGKRDYKGPVVDEAP